MSGNLKNMAELKHSFQLSEQNTKVFFVFSSESRKKDF